MKGRLSVAAAMAGFFALAASVQRDLGGFAGYARMFNIRESKGRGVKSGRKQANKSTNWLAKLNGQTNGAREKARRVRQMEKGMLHA